MTLRAIYRNRVNALLRAFLISTLSAGAWELFCLHMCQCPTSGFSHFYRRPDSGDSEQSSLVSMPYFGLFSFLPLFYCQKSKGALRCQCPTSGFSHFYFTDLSDADVDGYCVNALLRAFLISTLSL